ncbi:Hypothetical predicted protein [Mytilus galloprovincialis]|uniref:Uncharacterized protein n=1 Tax=Mytilus galloprovincialis TaxID=29158 RepID=A0A8B6ENH5_MYTGA|nr:Hypothetical predicted protein [Mytilus galloprovincialis]
MDQYMNFPMCTNDGSGHFVNNSMINPGLVPSQERQKLEDKLDETNQRDFWKSIGHLGIASNRKRCISLAIVDEDGNEATDKNVVLNKWKNDFQTLFHQNGNSDSDLDVSTFNTEVDVSPLNEPISREEF